MCVIAMLLLSFRLQIGKIGLAFSYCLYLSQITILNKYDLIKMFYCLLGIGGLILDNQIAQR